MDLEQNFQLLQKLISARGPCGQEDEVREICKEELRSITEEIWTDPAGNLIGKIPGTESNGSNALRIMVHMDELSLIVKRINEDGSLRVNPLGGIFPFTYGQGPVDIMGDKEICPGVLSFGCMHTTKETAHIHKMLPEEHRGLGKTPVWEDVSVFTGKSLRELKEIGIHPGTRVVIAQARRQLFSFGDYIAGYFLDNRAAIFVALAGLKKMKAKGAKAKKDIYFVATCSEEIGAHGASYAARTLPGEVTLAIDVGPVAKEYQTNLSAAPIIVYQDTIGLYDKGICDTLLSLGTSLGLHPQCAVWGSYGSDASLAQSRGQAAKSGLLCFPVENTHGYEIMHKHSLDQCAKLLEAYFYV